MPFARPLHYNCHEIIRVRAENPTLCAKDSGDTVLATKSKEIMALATNIVNDPKSLDKYLDVVAGSSRRERQLAASVVAQVAHEDPQLLAPHVDVILEALGRPEAQTRWEALDILTHLVDIESRSCEKAVADAENALFDEDSGPLRLAAMRFLCKLGSTTEARSLKCWPLIDEAIQCYHGDYEFPDMMAAVIDFSAGKLAPEVKTELKARMKFDAENSKGGLKKRAQQIIDNLK
jgi:hypothetical protein